MAEKRVVVIGASKGGVHALVQLCRQLPADFGAPICVVLHIGSHRSHLPEILSAAGVLPAMHPQDGQRLEVGRVFVAPPDHHMRIEGEVVRLLRGPKEHHSRPAIDPLFRSAAVSFGAGVIGVVLTGLLDDGTPGMQAIKEVGGTCVIQDPAEAEESSMPLSVATYVQVDHQVGLDAMVPLLVKLIAEQPERHELMFTSNRTHHEEAISLGIGDAVEHLRAIAKPSTFSCPDCNGTLWEVSKTAPARYRCHTGHAFTLESLRSAHSSATDEALWAAIRALQEKRELTLIARDVAAAAGHAERSRHLERRALELDTQANQLRSLVASVDETDG